MLQRSVTRPFKSVVITLLYSLFFCLYVPDSSASSATENNHELADIRKQTDSPPFVKVATAILHKRYTSM